MSYNDQSTEQVDPTNLFVSNFSWNGTEEDLREMFSPYVSEGGEIESVKIIVDRETGRSRGFGFVKFSKVEDAEAAMKELNEFEFQGRAIGVSVAQPKPPRREGGNFGGGRRDY